MAIIFIASLGLFLGYSYVSITTQERVPFTPDETLVLFFSTLFSQNGTLIWDSILNQEYGTDILRPRLLVELGNNAFTTPYSAGFIVTMSAAREVGLIGWAVPFFGLLLALSVYGILKEVYDRRMGLVGMLLVGTFPSVLFWSNTYLDIIPSTSLIFLGVYLLIRGNRTRNPTLAFIAGIAFAFAVLLRVEQALLLLPIGLTAVAFRRHFGWKFLGWGALGLALGFVPLVILNIAFLGTPLSYGPAVQSGQDLTGYLMSTPLAIVPIIETSFRYLVLYPLAFTVLVLVGLAAGKSQGNGNTRFLLVLLFATSITLIAAYGGRSGTYGFDRVTPISSMARFLLPVHILLILVAVGALRRVGISHAKRLIPVVVAIMAFSMFVAFQPGVEGSLPHLGSVVDGYFGLQEELKTLHGNSDSVVVLTKTWDKFLFPQAHVALVFTLDELVSNPDLSTFYPISDVQTEVIPLVKSLILDGYRVFLTTELRDLIPLFGEGGLDLVQRSVHFYELVMSST